MSEKEWRKKAQYWFPEPTPMHEATSLTLSTHTHCESHTLTQRCVISSLSLQFIVFLSVSKHEVSGKFACKVIQSLVTQEGVKAAEFLQQFASIGAGSCSHTELFKW